MNSTIPSIVDTDDDPATSEEYPVVGRLLRRNSISMPSALNKLDAEVIEQQHIDQLVDSHMVKMAGKLIKPKIVYTHLNIDKFKRFNEWKCSKSDRQTEDTISTRFTQQDLD